MRERNAWKLLIALAVFFLYWLTGTDGFELTPRQWALVAGCVASSVIFLLKKLGKKLGDRVVTCSHCGKEISAQEKVCPHCGNRV